MGKVYATKFESSLEPTHKVIDSSIRGEILRGTHAECLAFVSGVEYCEVSKGTREIWDNVIIKKLEEEKI